MRQREARRAKHSANAPIPPRITIVVLLVCTALAGEVLIQAQRETQSRENWQTAVARGRYDFATGSCISCHALAPISSAGGAIDLTHEGHRRTLAWLQHEIRFPTSIRPPTPAGQADDLAIFLSSQK